jgi:hypothetical protein
MIWWVMLHEGRAKEFLLCLTVWLLESKPHVLSESESGGSVLLSEYEWDVSNGNAYAIAAGRKETENVANCFG